jgi:hypothetical protein
MADAKSALPSGEDATLVSRIDRLVRGRLACALHQHVEALCAAAELVARGVAVVEETRDAGGDARGLTQGDVLEGQRFGVSAVAAVARRRGQQRRHLLARDCPRATPRRFRRPPLLSAPRRAASTSALPAPTPASSFASGRCAIVSTPNGTPSPAPMPSTTSRPSFASSKPSRRAGSSESPCTTSNTGDSRGAVAAPAATSGAGSGVAAAGCYENPRMSHRAGQAQAQAEMGGAR